jgi:preprotein translocase subunit SecD
MKRILTSFILLMGSFSYAGEPVLTSQDFSHAHVVSRKGKVILQATLTDSASTKLKEFSLNHVGQKVAILNGGEVIAMPVIRVPLNRDIEIDALSKTEAENMARLINHEN